MLPRSTRRPQVTLLAHLVGVSERVAATPARLSKVRTLADFLSSLPPEDIDTAVLYLSGDTPQGRIGIGYASLKAAATTAAATVGTLTIGEIDNALASLATLRGKGSAAGRDQALGSLFSRATLGERGFLIPLLAGELRQGALAGVMQDAIAEASGLPGAEIRRAAMFAGNLGRVARAALTGGVAALGAFQLEVFAPIAPMLAQTAATVGEALRELGGEAVFEWKMDGARIQVHKAERRRAHLHPGTERCERSGSRDRRSRRGRSPPKAPCSMARPLCSMRPVDPALSRSRCAGSVAGCMWTSSAASCPSSPFSSIA